MPNHNPQVHVFTSSDQAYDATQCNDAIKTGDILHVPEEGNVIAFADTWPTRLTGGDGHSTSFHEFEPTYRDQFAADFPQTFELAANLELGILPANVKRTIHPDLRS